MPTMRIVVASDVEVGSHRAHAINVVKTAGGFQRLGHDVTVLCRAGGCSPEEAARSFGEPGLRWELAPALTSPVPESLRAEQFGRWVGDRLAAGGCDLLYARHFRAGLAGPALGIPTVIETHAHPGDQNPLLQRAIDATRGPLASLVTISSVLGDYYVSRGANPGRIHIVPDGVDLEMFTPPGASRGTGLCPFDRTSKRGHALYAGQLFDDRGIPTIIEAAALAPEIGFELVGGAPADVERARTRAAQLGAGNVRTHGHQPYADVPRWLWHADVLLLPQTAGAPWAAWASPVKLGEYLASGPPVVASAIPGLQDWVNEPAVRWFTPDSPGDLARAIDEALRESAPERGARQAAARALAESFSYPRRAAAILEAGREAIDHARAGRAQARARAPSSAIP